MISYASRKLRPYEVNYLVHHIESLFIWGLVYHRRGPQDFEIFYGSEKYEYEVA